jgi:hypothetical protein
MIRLPIAEAATEADATDDSDILATDVAPATTATLAVKNRGDRT